MLMIKLINILTENNEPLKLIPGNSYQLKQFQGNTIPPPLKWDEKEYKFIRTIKQSDGISKFEFQQNNGDKVYIDTRNKIWIRPIK